VASWASGSQEGFDSCPERRKIAFDDLPDETQVDPEILLDQLVSKA